MIVLGLETSCDETAAAVVEDSRTILGSVVLSQIDDHRPYGGVVPEIAARAHVAHLDGLIVRAMGEAGVGFEDLDAVAATGGPGLIGGVMVGVTMAKAIAFGRGLPFVAVNHLEAHALTVRLTDDVPFPYLLLLVSGGHCQLLIVHDLGRYERIGTTIDDAVGEAFDKAAKLLGLGFPGGPLLERVAEKGTPGRFSLPRPLKGRPGCDFSFSGLKTAVRRAIETLGDGADDQARADLAMAFQEAVTDVLVDRVGRGLVRFRETYSTDGALVVAGGVAANQTIRHHLAVLADEHDIPFVAPPPALCTDNAAMVAWAAIERLRGDLPPDDLSFRPRPRWPLDTTAVPALGDPSGKAGAKA